MNTEGMTSEEILNLPKNTEIFTPEEDWDDFVDSYEVEPRGYVLAGAGAALIVGLLALAAWWAFK